MVTKMKPRFRVDTLMLAVAIAAIVCSLRYQYRQAMERDAWLMQAQIDEGEAALCSQILADPAAVFDPYRTDLRQWAVWYRNQSARAASFDRFSYAQEQANWQKSELFDTRHMQAMKTIRTEARKRGITSARTVIASRGFFGRIVSLWPSFLAIVVLIALLMRRRLRAAVS
jgi:hypothetical protein